MLTVSWTKQRLRAIRFTIFALIVQFISLIGIILFIRSDRSHYVNVVENYPVSTAGDQEYNNHNFMVILQYALSIVLICICFCLVKKEETKATEETPAITKYIIQIWRCFSAQYLVPVLLTVGLCLTLPLKQVMPSYVVNLLGPSILLQSYLIISSVGSCNLVVTSFCFLSTGSYLLYYMHTWFELEISAT